MLKISFSPLDLATQHALILTVADKQQLGEQGVKLDRKLGGAIRRAMAESHFNGAKAQSLTILAPAKSRLSRLILVGIGEASQAAADVYQVVGGTAYAALTGKDSQASLVIDNHKGATYSSAYAAAHAAFGVRLRSYRFDKYHTKLKAEQKPSLKSLSIGSKDAIAARQQFALLDKIAEGVYLTRDVVSEPPNVIFPETLAQECLKLQELGVKVEVLDERLMKKLGMGALLGVAQGSVNGPRLVSMSWTGDPAAKNKQPIALVGKGVTFDSGGLSLKPPASMEDMKWDMAGAGTVIGTLKALAGRKAKVNVVGVVGLVENMPSGSAQRPGDVVKTMSGQTVEVLNTDAEGRLVLADALWYAQDKFNPRYVVDLATLTGAVIVALGHEYAGLFTNNEGLGTKLLAAGKAVGEKLWEFPLGEAYDKGIDSPIADMQNIGPRGEAGSIMGAVFLQRFIKKGVAWAHLDIAGVAWQGKDKALCPKGATAFGVRLLDHFVTENWEHS